MDSFLDDITTEATPPAPERNWSPLQQAVFDALEHTQDNILIQAAAGSGKTTTIVEGMNHVSGSALFLAFNKSIAQDIAARLTCGDAKTLNGLGHGICMKYIRGARLNANKTSELLKKLIPDELRDHAYAAQRAISLAKSNGFGLNGDTLSQPEYFEDIIDAYDLGVPAELSLEVARYASSAFQLLLNDQKEFDFDDQLYWPLYFSWEFPTYGNVFVDEAQDLSPIQHAMLGALKDRGARIVAVGDRHQAIYGFRGASVDSMDILKGSFAMTELPLSISYRCPKAVVREAQKLCPTIQWHESAAEGAVSYQESIWCLILDPPAHDPQLFDDGVMVICRNNAPLFKAILRHVRAKKPCQVKTNFLDSFAGWIRGFKKNLTRDLLPRLDDWYVGERGALRIKGASRSRLETLRDKWETAKMLCSEYETVNQLLDLLKALGLSTRGPIFSTVHKAKGLEAKDVYLLRPDLLPSPWATDEKSIQQENNLLYVAITRAQNTFTYGVKPEGF